jgi:hypothetical protein
MPIAAGRIMTQTAHNQSSKLSFIRRLWSLAAFVFAISLAAPAWATYVCQGTIDSVALNASGVLTVTSTGAGFNSGYICQIGATRNGVGPEQCKAIYTLLLVARSTGQQVQWYYNDALTCSTHPSWADLTGWYYGPLLMD